MKNHINRLVKEIDACIAQLQNSGFVMEVRRITINIAGRNYPLNVPAAEETLRRVGKQIEE